MKNTKFFQIFDESNVFIRQHRITGRSGMIGKIMGHVFDTIQGREWRQCAQKIKAWIDSMHHEKNGTPTDSCPDQYKYKMSVVGGASLPINYFDLGKVFEALRADNDLFQSVMKTVTV
jgi:hypothetical protein